MEAEELEENFLPFMVNGVPDFIRKKAEAELNENDENRTRCVSELRKELANYNVTKDIHFEDYFLIQFLRQSKYNVHKAFRRIENLIFLRKKHADAFTSLTDNYFETNPWRQLFYFLPKRCPDGCLIMYARPGLWNAEVLPYPMVKQFFALVAMQIIRDPVTQISGVKIIFDFGGPSIHLLRLFTPFKLHLFYQALFQCFPLRRKGMHFVHNVLAMKLFWAVIRPFLPEKARNRFHFHSAFEELYDHFPRTVLPSEYGGDSERMEITDWLRKASKDHGECPAGGQPNLY